MAHSEAQCHDANEAMKALVHRVLPEDYEFDPPLKSFAGPFGDDDTPLGHAMAHMVHFALTYKWFPMLDIVPAAGQWCEKNLVDAFRTGVGIGRIYEMARHDETVSQEDLAALASDDA